MNQIVKRAISQMEPITKAAQLRQWMPEIEERLATGVKLVAIHQTLAAIGFDLPFQTLKTYLYRYRRQAGSQKSENNATEKGGNPGNSSRKSCLSESSDHLLNESDVRPSISIQEIGRLMHPDPIQQAKKLARYERVARQQRRSQK